MNSIKGFVLIVVLMQAGVAQQAQAGSFASDISDIESTDIFSLFFNSLFYDVPKFPKIDYGDSVKNTNGFITRCNGYNKVYFEGGRTIYCD